MLLGQRRVSILTDEDPETRARMPDLFEAFEKLEAELRRHLELLRVRANQSEVGVFGNHCP
jgi:hypothetical protein